MVVRVDHGGSGTGTGTEARNVVARQFGTDAKDLTGKDVELCVSRVDCLVMCTRRVGSSIVIIGVNRLSRGWIAQMQGRWVVGEDRMSGEGSGNTTTHGTWVSPHVLILRYFTPHPSGSSRKLMEIDWSAFYVRGPEGRNLQKSGNNLHPSHGRDGGSRWKTLSAE